MWQNTHQTKIHLVLIKQNHESFTFEKNFDNWINIQNQIYVTKTYWIGSSFKSEWFKTKVISTWTWWKNNISNIFLKI